jgi:hypothetical protein
MFLSYFLQLLSFAATLPVIAIGNSVVRATFSSTTWKSLINSLRLLGVSELTVYDFS